jgi:hypothetical protein
MMSKAEIQAWLETLPDDAEIAIDDGGITLVVLGHRAYCEVGGIPDDEGEEETPSP